MADGERCYQILRGRLYQRLPLLALPLGLLEWREGSAPGTDGTFFYAPEAWLHAAVKTPGDAEKVLLHSVLHAMLGHPWLPRRNRDAARWALACDMSAELLRLRLLGLPLESTAGRAFYACKNGTAFSAAARKPPASKACTPRIVLPAGLHTASLSAAGCVPVCKTSFAEPSAVCAAY